MQGHESDCCIITSSKVGEMAAGDQRVRAGLAFHLKTLMLIPRLNEHYIPESEGKKYGCPPRIVKKVKSCLFIAKDAH